MTKPIDTLAITKGTARSWEAWLDFLDEIDAKSMPHAEIARRVRETGDASGWWAQSIAVAYEQHIGRRVPGQASDGAFQVSVTKTVAGAMDEVMAQWASLMEKRSELSGVQIVRGAEQSASEKWRYWRCGLADGTRVVVAVDERVPGKCGLSIGHEKLGSQEDVERWRAFWKDVLKAL